MLYFAYCTLLDRYEMVRFCPEAEARETGRISGWRVAFASYAEGRGGCHLVAAAGHEVYGVLYALSEAEASGLDTISGVPQGFYERIDVEVATEGGQRIPAVTYVIPRPTGPFEPSDDYVRPILTGAAALGLPADYVSELRKLVATSRSRQTS
jgi:gamma-glutamylcyclotransferase (GGCT)/AIG2-like uncharacterized protein YtfP